MSTTPLIEPLVKKPREIEIITCHCGSIIAGTVLPLSPEWGDEWNRSKADYIKEGYTVSVVANAQLASCRCKDVIAELRAERAELIRQRDEGVPKWISVQESDGRLTEEQWNVLSDRLIEEHRKYADRLGSGEWAKVAVRKVISQFRDYAESRNVAALAQCFRLSGADPDGDEDWRIAPRAVKEVERLRDEYNEQVEEIVELERRLATPAVALSQEVKIDLQSWDRTCGDGCCTDYGVTIKINGKELPFQGGYNIGGEHVEAILKYFGIEATVTETHAS